MSSYTYGYGKSYSYSGSQILAQILYNVQGVFEYQTDNDGNTFIDNKGSSNTTNDLLLYSGRAVELTGEQSVDIPIHHTLGEELVTNGTLDTDSGWNKLSGATISGGVANIVFAGSGNPAITQNMGLVSGKTYMFSLDITRWTSGNIEVYISSDTRSGFYIISGVGHIDIILTVDTIGDVGFAGSGLSADFDIDNISVKQITTENSFLTYQDLDTKEIVTLGNSVDGGSSKELVTNGTFDSNVTGWVSNNVNATITWVSDKTAVYQNTDDWAYIRTS